MKLWNLHHKPWLNNIDDQMALSKSRDSSPKDK